ncbi:hypothetical protein EVAR_19472_1 [Eumeta japonica]|uniref:Uncharacterized protein n=1 Tax=Eumeta variegata TaxID=151549 RepID=A0A4C1VA18_EUMVA|nr:hypothetical protein EVAR_19472_1 [Eumeta japonica]
MTTYSLVVHGVGAANAIVITATNRFSTDGLTKHGAHAFNGGASGASEALKARSRGGRPFNIANVIIRHATNGGPQRCLIKRPARPAPDNYLLIRFDGGRRGRPMKALIYKPWGGGVAIVYDRNETAGAVMRVSPRTTKNILACDVSIYF